MKNFTLNRNPQSGDCRKLLCALALVFFSTSLLIAQNATGGGSISGQQSVCPGKAPSTILSVTDASGGDDSEDIEYLWMYATAASLAEVGWQVAPGDNDMASYTPPSSYKTTFYIRCARRSGYSLYPTESNVVTVTVLPSALAKILGSTTVAAGETFELRSKSTNAIYEWDFGDGTTDDSKSVSHSYDMPGVYTVTLKVTNSYGCTSTTMIQVEVFDPLPVDLVSFDGYAQGEAVMLKWETASELNNAYFMLETSTDGSRFETVTEVEGAGTTSSAQYYSFLDEEAKNGINYYRLTQVDLDGASEVFEIISVEVEREAKVFQVSPNPVRDIAWVELPENISEESHLELIAMTGQVMKIVNVNSNSGRQEVMMSGIAAGVYFIRMVDRLSNEVLNQKIIKR